MIRGAIFDLGGVVVEWSNSITYSWIEEKFGIPATDFKRIAEEEMPEVQIGRLSEAMWMEEVFKRFGLDKPEGYAEVWGSTFEAAKYNEEVVELIKVLRSRRYLVVALSNLEPSRMKWLRDNHIEGIFDEVIFSCEVGLRKPDISPAGLNDLEIFKLTLDVVGLKAEECIYVDDNPNCTEAATRAGINSILFTDVEQLKEQLMKRKIL
jgi:HAD superfamily hydrolase (TIGR01509 family)